MTKKSDRNKKPRCVDRYICAGYAARTYSRLHSGEKRHRYLPSSSGELLLHAQNVQADELGEILQRQNLGRSKLERSAEKLSSVKLDLSSVAAVLWGPLFGIHIDVASRRNASFRLRLVVG